jgi:prefoldin subunit 5
VGVGARISVETPIGEAKKTLEHRRGELDTAMKKLQDSYVDLASKLSELNASVENLVQEIQGK